MRAPAARHGRVRRALCQSGARHSRGRPLLQRGEALLRLRSRQRAVLSAGGGRYFHPVAGAAVARERLRDPRAPAADVVFFSAVELRRVAGASPRCGRDGACPVSIRSPQRGRLRPDERAPRRLRRRGATGQRLPSLPRTLRRRDPRRHRLHRMPAHVYRESSRRRAPRLEWASHSRLRRASPRR